MNPENINSIDENWDKKIGLDELKNALKTWFFDNEENLKQIEKSLNNPQLNEEDKTFFDSLVLAINDEINAIKWWNISPEDIDLLNVWKILLWEDNEKVQELERLINNENFDLMDDNVKLTPEQELNKWANEKNNDNLDNIELTSEEIENIRVIRELWIEIPDWGIQEVKNLRLTPERIANLKIIKDLWIAISVYDIRDVMDLTLTEAQQNNINNIQKLWIYVSPLSIQQITDLVLTPEEIINIETIKGLWFEMSAWDIKEIKDLVLTPEEINNAKTVSKLWIDIFPWEILKVKDLVLTPEEIKNIENIMEMFSGLWIWTSVSDIQHIKDLVLTPGEIKNIKTIKGLWFEMSTWDIKEIKDLVLTPEEIKNIEEIRDLWFEIFLFDIERIKDLRLNSEQFKNIKRIKDELWIRMTIWELEEFVDLVLNDDEIENLKNLKKVWINLYSWNIDTLKNIKLLPEEINTINEIIGWLGIEIYSRDLDKVKDLKLTSEEIDNIMIIKRLWIDILAWDLKEIKDLKINPEQLENIKRIQNKLWIEISAWELKDIMNLILTEDQLDNLEKIQKELWIKIMAIDIKKIINVSAEKIEKIKSLKKEFWIDFDLDDLSCIDFDECEQLLSIKSEDFYERYNYSEEEIQLHHHYKKWRIIESIQMYVQSTIVENRSIWTAEIIEKIRSDLVTLPVQERFCLISWISKVVNKFNTVRKYLNFENWLYKTPKELLCAMRWITDSNIINGITDDITVIQHWTWMTFFVWDEKSYQTIYDMSLTDSGRRSGGFNIWGCVIKELEWTLSVVNWKNPGENTEEYEYWTMWHEWQHNWNSYFMSDKELFDPITRGKDEITAYLREWNTCKTIENILTRQAKYWWLYQYGLEWEEWENHKRQIKELLGYVHVLLELTNRNMWLTRENVISMLSDTPVNERKLLYENFRKSIKFYDISLWLNEYLWVKNIENNGNNKPLEEVHEVSWWLWYDENTLGFNMEEFRWTWNATKENLENEIQNAWSLDELKHILSDPKYSHIGRWPNNVWWIEISVMIDNVVEWNMKITFIPTEIRSYVQRFIN